MVLALHWFREWLKVDSIKYELTLSHPNITFVKLILVPQDKSVACLNSSNKKYIHKKVLVLQKLG